MKHKSRFFCVGIVGLLVLFCSQSFAGVQYSNDFENPSSEDPSEAWPEWVKFSDATSVFARNGRLEWNGSGGNDDWIRLDLELPNKYVMEFDFFHPENVNARFSVWPIVQPGESIADRHNYFLRENTHYYNLADTIPSEGPVNMNLPVGSPPHRLRFEVDGDHVIFLYKDRGQGGWILVDDRDFPPFGEGSRYIQLGNNHDGGTSGIHYVDNFVMSYSDVDLFSYSNNFNNPSSDIPNVAWPEWVDFGGNTALAENDRLEWNGSGGNDDWLRLDIPLPMNFVMEFDFFHPEDVNARFSVWPLVQPGESIADRHNYFLRENTHYYNLADTIPSEGPVNMNLPVGSPPHRLRFEVTGDHVVFLYKDRGEGGWILVDDRDFPPFPDAPRYIQLGNNHDSGTSGIHYVDNFEINELAADRAVVDRSIGAQIFEANTPIPVSLQMTVMGNIPSLTITEGYPVGWSVANISHGGVVSDGNIIWSLTNQSESITLTYDAIPPRLIFERVGGFSGSVDSGGGEERITGDTAITILLPYLYRECIDLDFSGSPVDGRNYPTEYVLGERYTQGMDGIPADTPYVRPGGGEEPAVDTEFVFQAGADFFFANPGIARDDPNYAFEGYRDDGEVTFEHGSSDTNAGLGSDRMTVGDWFRYSFDLGEGDQVILLNLSVNTWNNGDSIVDVYIDNQFKAAINAAETAFNAYQFYTVGPFEVTGGVHSIVLAIPGPNLPDSVGRMEVVRVKGIGQVARQLTADGFFEAGQSITVSLTAEALYGSYTSFIDEFLPSGIEVTDAGIGQLEGNHLLLRLDPTSTSQTVNYTISTPVGVKFLVFNGYCDVGLPLAERVRGDVSVTNQLWLFGVPTEEATDDFDGDSLGSSWEVEYGSDPSLSTDYQDGVTVEVADGVLTLGADVLGEADKFNDWSNGRRAPLILRTDIPDGDWRIETDVSLIDTYTWIEFQTGLFVAFNDGSDTDVSGDEYLLGFYEDEISAALSGEFTIGSLEYHSLTDEMDWLDLIFAGEATVTLGITKRSDELVFSAKLPGHSWQMIGLPASEDRTPTRFGLFARVWGSTNYSVATFDRFTLNKIEVFTDVSAWELY